MMVFFFFFHDSRREVFGEMERWGMQQDWDAKISIERSRCGMRWISFRLRNLSRKCVGSRCKKLVGCLVRIARRISRTFFFEDHEYDTLLWIGYFLSKKTRGSRGVIKRKCFNSGGIESSGTERNSEPKSPYILGLALQRLSELMKWHKLILLRVPVRTKMSSLQDLGDHT